MVNAIVSAIAGRMYDSFGARKPAMVGFLIALVGAVMLFFTSTSTALSYVIAAHVILMVGCPLAMSPSQSNALNSLPALESGDGSTILNTMQQVVGALATALATSFMELGRGLGTGSTAARFTNGVHFGIVFTIVLVIIGVILAAMMKENADSVSVKLD